MLLSSKYTYKIYPDEEEIREVIIVPPEKIYIPKEIFTEIPAETDLENSQEFLREVFKNEFESDIPKITSSIPDKNLSYNQITGLRAKDKATGVTFPSNLTSTFKLKLPLGSQTDLPAKYELNLSPDSAEKMLLKKGYSPKKINLPKYLYSDFQSLPSPIRPSSSGRHRSGTTLRQARASFRSNHYDLTPWAREVVDRIQKNWFISPTPKISQKGLVEISVIVQKNGELSSIKIVNSSTEPLFDQAALKALELSSPFPKLPDDFPLLNLEAYFVFQYHD